MEPGAAFMLACLFAPIIIGVVCGKREAIAKAAMSSTRIIKRLLPSGDDKNDDE